MLLFEHFASDCAACCFCFLLFLLLFLSVLLFFFFCCWCCCFCCLCCCFLLLLRVLSGRRPLNPTLAALDLPKCQEHFFCIPNKAFCIPKKRLWCPKNTLVFCISKKDFCPPKKAHLQQLNGAHTGPSLRAAARATWELRGRLSGKHWQMGCGRQPENQILPGIARHGGSMRRLLEWNGFSACG